MLHTSAVCTLLPNSLKEQTKLLHSLHQEFLHFELTN